MKETNKKLRLGLDIRNFVMLENQTIELFSSYSIYKNRKRYKLTFKLTLKQHIIINKK